VIGAAAVGTTLMLLVPALLASGPGRTAATEGVADTLDTARRALRDTAADRATLQSADTPGPGPPPLGAPALAHLPDGRLLPEGLVAFSTGWHSPFSGAEEGGRDDTGTGNQTYHGEIGWGAGAGWNLLLGVEWSDDETWARMGGVRIPQARGAVALGAAMRLVGEDPTSSRLGNGGPVDVLLRWTGELLYQRSSPGLFNVGRLADGELRGAFAVELPVSWAVTPAVILTLVPSFSGLPSSILGAPYWGSTLRVGGRWEQMLGGEAALEASGELPLGPGDNVLDRRGAMRRVPVWDVGVRWRPTGRVALRAHLTNSAGTTPATRHLTLPSSPTTLYGVAVAYTPSVRERRTAPARGGADTDHRAIDRQGVTLPPPRSLQGGRSRVRMAMDSRGAYGLQAARALGDRFTLDVTAARLRGIDAPSLLGVDLGVGAEYRVGLQLDLLDERRGAWLTWSGRASVGRDLHNQQGYLVAETVLSRQLGRGLRLLVSPLAVESGGRDLRSVAVGGAGNLGPLLVFPEWRGSLTGESPVWTLGVEPAHLPRMVPESLRLRIFGTNASAMAGLGRALPDPDGFRVGGSLSWGF
jgi:hypothetical protein